MNPLIIIAALACIALGGMAIACLEARFKAYEHDWREDWCTFDCWAPDGQQGPCRDCAGRRAARR